MKTITVNVSEPAYREFQLLAKRSDRTASELIRDAMDLYLEQARRGGHSVLSLQPSIRGKVLKPLTAADDLLAEMSSHP